MHALEQYSRQRLIAKGISSLWHASAFKHNELMPGYKRSGELVKWDKTEDNTWLYVSADKATALNMGVASAIEKAYAVKRFKFTDDLVQIDFDVSQTPASLGEIEKIQIYLYEIDPKDEHEWLLVNNQVNGLKDEFKTRQTITDISSCTTVLARDIIAGRQVKITPDNGYLSHWTN